jgi:diaminopimelate epimerase
MTVRTGAGIHTVWVVGNERMRISITDPTQTIASLRLEHAGRTFEASRIDTGVPHVAIALETREELETLDIVGHGRPLRSHPAVMPEGANINFYTVEGDGAIRMRTYERGVEAETLACGTGACSVACAASLRHSAEPPVTILTRGGDLLTIGFRREGSRFTDITLEGPAVITYKGELGGAMLP